MTKQCTKCGEVKGLGEFAKNKGRKYGVSAHCKYCSSIYNKEYKEKHKRRLIKYKEDNHSKIIASHRKYNEVNRNKINKKGREYIKVNQNKINQKGRLNTEKLSDTSVRGIISNNTGLKGKDIPQDLVEAKRLVIMAKRKGLISYHI